MTPEPECLYIRGIRKFYSLFHNFPRIIKDRIKYGRSLSKHDKIIWIDPSEIEYNVVPGFGDWMLSSYYSFVVGGNWDKNNQKQGSSWHKYDQIYRTRKLHKITNSARYKSYKDHFKRGVPWKETELYSQHIKHDFPTKRFDSKKGLLERLSKIDELYDSIKNEGYKMQSKLVNNQNSVLDAKDWRHEVQINISRDGDFIFDDGRNRCIIAKLLDIDKIPVRIIARHEQWQLVRQKLFSSDDITAISDDFSKYKSHPDMADVIK